MRTYVYVDGFNLYYGSLKNSPFKWLDLSCLCQKLLPRDDIQRINYYTARVSARPHDLNQPQRQQTYLRALQTYSHIYIVYGHFLSHATKMRVAYPSSTQPRYVDVIKTEEKGSDVNLATHLLHDGHRGHYELAVVISNDSDLLEPIRIVIQELGLRVGILNPHKHPSKTLTDIAWFHKNIRKGVLGDCQFPRELTDKNGTFHKPATW